MNVETNKQTVRRLYDLLNAGNVEEIQDMVTDGYDEHDPLPGQGAGRDGVLDRYSMLIDALAPQFTIEDVIAEGDRVVVRWMNSGTHVGEFAGIPPTGRAFSIAGVDIYRIAESRLAEHWHVVDQLAMLGQLGVLPQSSPA